jgi:hypothetical protein
MIRRILLLIISWLATSSVARAHNLEMAYQLLPGWRVQVRGWYEGGDPASGARVRITQADGHIVSEGRMDKYGIFNFDITCTKTLNIVASVTGHRAEQTITGETLQRHLIACCCSCMAPQPMQLPALLELQVSKLDEARRSQPSSDLSAPFPWVGMSIGVGGLLLVAIVFTWLTKRKPA